MSPPTTPTYAFFSRLRLPEERGFLEFRALPVHPRLKPQQNWQEWPPPEGFDGEYAFGGEYEVYYGVLLRTRRQGGGQHVGPGSVAWAEFDLGGSQYLEVSKAEAKNLPPGVLREAANRLWLDLYDELEGLELRPLAAVYSGQGVHVYWGLSETRSPAWLERANKALIKLLAGYNPEKSPYDRARILRVPGTVHRKNPARPLPVELLYLGETRHDPEKLEGLLELEEPKPLPQALERAVREGTSLWVPSDHDVKLLLEGWNEGGRNQLAMGLGGWCAAHGVPEKVALDLVERICRETGDAEVANRQGAVAASYRRYFAGLPTLGFASLKRKIPGLEGKGRVSLGVLSPSASDARAEEVGGQTATLPPEYRLDAGGQLVKVRFRTTRFGVIEEYSELAPKPLEVRGLLTDLSTGAEHYRLGWTREGGEVVERTLSRAAAATKAGLLALAEAGAPVNETNAALLTQYVQRYAAYNAAALPHAFVTTRLGWHGGIAIGDGATPRPGDRFVLPGGEVEVLGVDERGWKPAGSLEGWLEGLSALLSWGVTPALVAAALSAVAPFVRSLRLNKNPILALTGASQSGKTSAIQFAISIWGDPAYNRSLYVDEGTPNGVMGRLMTRQDLPFALDELQRFDDTALGGLVYALASGAEKVRARRDGAERSAGSWCGVAFLTAETPAVRRSLRDGAVNRLIELSDPPLGLGRSPEGEARLRALQRGMRHYGQARSPLLELMRGLEVEELVAGLAEAAKAAGCPGDMAPAVALAGLGVQLLDVLAGGGHGLDGPVVVYLAERLAAMRSAQGSLGARALAAFWGLVAAYRPDELASLHDEEEVRGPNRDLIAFREGRIWFINPGSKEVARALEEFGGLDAQRREWDQRGWLARPAGDDRNLTWSKSCRGIKTRWTAVYAHSQEEI